MHDKKTNFVGDAKRGSLYTETTLSAQEFTELKRRILSDSARKISIDENTADYRFLFYFLLLFCLFV